MTWKNVVLSGRAALFNCPHFALSSSHVLFPYRSPGRADGAKRQAGCVPDVTSF